MSLKTWQACVLSAGAAAGALLLASGNHSATAQVGGGPEARWQVTVIERSQREAADRIERDAILIDGTTGQTWILPNAQGLPNEWVPLQRRGR